MRKGSLTVFFSLILTILCTLFFSMSEAIRIVGMSNRSKVVTRETLASVCSEYQPYLWDTYQILAVDGAYGKEQWEETMVENRMDDFLWNNCNSGKGFFQVEPVGTEIEKYSLLTDGEGAIFMHQAANMAIKQMSMEAIQNWSEMVKNLNGDEETAIDVDAAVDAAQEALEHPEKMEGTGEAMEEPKLEELPPATYDNPFDIYGQIKEKGWLGLVTDGENISEKSMSTDQVVSKRTLRKGTETISQDAMDLPMYEWYLLKQFSHYGNQKEGPGLAYQVEYIIAGKSSDKENLEYIVGALLGVREVANMVTITSSPQMMQQAAQLSVSLAGASANPALIKLVQAGVIAVWALVESILDVRTLLNGGKVAIKKTQEQWTSQLYALAAYLSPSQKAKESEKGISYAYYLASKLLLLNRKALGLRPLDLMEEDLRQQEKYTNCRMDHMICSMEAFCSYSSQPIFTSVIGEGIASKSLYDYQCHQSISY